MYHFDLVCPRCNRKSEAVQYSRTPAPRINCGDCLMDDVEIVELKVLGITQDTIYVALKRKLGREPTHKELCEDVARILHEGTMQAKGTHSRRART